MIPRREPLAGTAGGYDPCPQCGHARVKHLSAPRGGCVAASWAQNDRSGRPMPARGSLCGCPRDNSLNAREVA